MSDNLNINEIIPPNDYEHRRDFWNESLIDKLTEEEKQSVENVLIDMLSHQDPAEADILIVTTLAYLKSRKSLQMLRDILEKYNNDVQKIIIAVSIFEIDRDQSMAAVAIKAFNRLDDVKDVYYVYNLISAFYYLAKFKNPEIDNIIKKYFDHSEYLLSYNSKQALGLNKEKK